MKYAQFFILATLVLQLFVLLWIDINGRPAQTPSGFAGVVGTVIAMSVTAWVYWVAGLFSAL